MSKKICILNNLTCTRRNLDAMRFVKYFEANEQEITMNFMQAEVVVLFTCGVIDQASKSALNAIQTLNELSCELIVAGCLPGIAPDEVSKVFLGKTITTKDLEKIDMLFPYFKIKFCQIEDQTKEYINFFSTDRFEMIHQKRIKQNTSEYFRSKEISDIECKVLRIETGCAGMCSYCSVRNAIGSVRSKPIDYCIKKVEEFISSNVKLIKIDGDDIGAYGVDINTTFVELLRKMINVDKNNTLTWGFENFNTIWLVKYIDELIKIVENKNIGYIFCSLQSGSSRILNLMNRYSDTNIIANCIKRLKIAIPNVVLSTAIIVGFPSETDEEFEESLLMIKDVGFINAVLFHYTDRPGAISYNYKNKINNDVIKNRIEYGRHELQKYGVHVSENYGSRVKGEYGR